MEEFKDILEFDSKYIISSYGYILNMKGKRIGSIGSDGYEHVNLKRDGKIFNIRTHKLVWKYFGDEAPTKGMVVDHINNVKSINGIDNLQLIPFRENVHKDQHIGLSARIGISWCETKKRWRAQISINNKRLHLGYRKTIEEAELLYQLAAL